MSMTVEQAMERLDMCTYFLGDEKDRQAFLVLKAYIEKLSYFQEPLDCEP